MDAQGNLFVAERRSGRILKVTGIDRPGSEQYTAGPTSRVPVRGLGLVKLAKFGFDTA